MDVLFNDYATILSDLKIDSFNLEEDKYSGVFLPVPFDEYWSSSIKVMLVGRETAGWNTDNNKNTINRVAEFVEKDKVFELLCEATGRYKKHLQVSKGGKREFNSEVRHSPMQPEGILGTPFRAA